MIKRYFFPRIEPKVQKMLDENSIENIEHVFLGIGFFELLSFAVFLLTRRGFGHEEWVTTGSVLFCTATCLSGVLISKLLKKLQPSHARVMAFKFVFYMLLSLWSIWASCRNYIRGEQILTFHAVQLLLVCFVALKPWLSALCTAVVYTVLYALLCHIDGAAGVNILNYAVLAAGTVIGMSVRYHAAIRMAEANVRLQKTKDSEIRDKVNILQAIADIYDNVNLIDFTDYTEMSVRDKDHVRHKLDLASQSHTIMSRRIRERVLPEQLERFIAFTDITTVRDRLKGKRLLSGDFIDMADGWIRAQYIPVDTDEAGLPIRVIFTTRNVDEEKRREEHLTRIAMMDELTHLYNRRSYEEDVREYRTRGLEEDFVLLSADVNGLKTVNDTVGHAAGDEIIRGAAECLLLAIGSRGRVYRMGGDEFAAILHTGDPASICRDIEGRAGAWKGQYAGKMSISTGYAAHADDRSLDIHELEKKADREMYLAKARHYEQNGVDRRRR